MQQIIVRKISSIRDFKTLAVAQIVENESKQHFFFMTVVSYEWVRDKLSICHTGRADDKTIADHFPILQKYARWDGISLEKMHVLTRVRFLKDMGELFGFAAGSIQIHSSPG